MARGRAPPPAPGRHPPPLPLRRCACSGQKRYAAHIRPPPLALPPSPPRLPGRSPLGSARARSGLRRALAVGSPSGSLAPPVGGGAARPPGPVRPPAVLAAPPAAASGGSASLASPWVLRVALCPLRAPWAVALAPLGLPWPPWAARCAGAPRRAGAAPRCAALALRAPARGLWRPWRAAFSGPRPRALFGVWGCAAAAALYPLRRRRSRVKPGPLGGPLTPAPSGGNRMTRGYGSPYRGFHNPGPQYLVVDRTWSL